jgi:hypothetical protein
MKSNETSFRATRNLVQTAAVPDTDSPLPDGEYDGFIFDIDEPSDASAPMRLHLTIVSGEHRGDVVDVAADSLGSSFVDLVGMPATITVVDGRPSVRVDR